MSRFVPYVGGVAAGIAVEQSYHVPAIYAGIALLGVFVYHMAELWHWPNEAEA